MGRLLFSLPFLLTLTQCASEGPSKKGLTKAEIASIIREHWSEIRDCSVRALPELPQTRAKVTLEFEIESSGKVGNAKAKSTAPSESLKGCVLSKLNSWKFPSADAKTEVRYPIYLNGTL